jgi:hypothetical protein
MSTKTTQTTDDTSLPRVCSDRILTTDLAKPQITTRSADGADRAIAPINKTWMNGSKLRVKFLGGTAEQQAIVKEQAGWWSAVANLSFEFGNAADSEIRISFDPNDGAWSYVGTDCKSIPLNQPTMNLGFMDGGTTAHEFGHAIGLAHEHQNPQGGIQWNEAVVIRETARAPNFWDEQTTRHNILRKYTADQIKGTAFDPNSIMLYFFPASWTLNGIATKANEVLSSVDKSFIAGAQMYPKQGGTVTTATELKVNPKKATSAAIGKFGEEDLYFFTAKTDGKYQVETKGPSDLVMKLFGPDSETKFIAEDDDSGTASNARIIRSLVAGKYYVQVRHYNPESGTGDYTIRVKKA